MSSGEAIFQEGPGGPHYLSAREVGPTSARFRRRSGVGPSVVSFIVVRAIVRVRGAPAEIQMTAIPAGPVGLPGSARLSTCAIVGE